MLTALLPSYADITRWHRPVNIPFIIETCERILSPVVSLGFVPSSPMAVLAFAFRANTDCVIILVGRLGIEPNQEILHQLRPLWTP